MEYLSIGLMSGTSVDAVDAALCKNCIEDGKISTKLVCAQNYSIPQSIRKRIFALFESGKSELAELLFLDRDIGELFADATNSLLTKSATKAKDISVIGSHGQTIWHIAGNPGSKNRASLQIGSGSIIAARTGIKTVTGFRNSDIAYGGTGAPLVPFFDKIIANNFEKPVAFQNFGGIANVCCIYKEKEQAEELFAFDTGPANMISDMLVGKMTKGQLKYDKDAEIGKTGTIIEDILSKWMRHPFLSKKPPKSSGREEFGSVFFEEQIEPLINSGISYCNLIRTAEAFTAKASALAYKNFLPELPKTVIVSGGGAHNPIIMSDLQKELPSVKILEANSVGLSTDFKEAMAFGLFGLLRVLEQTNTDKNATGAIKSVSAGAIWLP